MNYKGAYSEDYEYAAGDVAVYTDNVPYVMHHAAPAGTDCHNVRYWERVPYPLGDVVMMFHEAFTGIGQQESSVNEAIEALQGVVFDDKTLILGSSTEDSDTRYALTVEDGEAGGELVISEIEEEAAEGEGGDN